MHVTYSYCACAITTDFGELLFIFSDNMKGKRGVHKALLFSFDTACSREQRGMWRTGVLQISPDILIIILWLNR